MGRTYRRRRRSRFQLIQSAELRSLYSWILTRGFRPVTPLRLALTPSGRGLISKARTRSGDCLIALPQSLLVTASKVRSIHRDLPPSLTDEELLCIFLLREKSNPSSAWRPYIDSIPGHFESPETYKSYPGKLPPGLSSTIDKWTRTAESAFLRVEKSVSLGLNFRDFLWAWCAVNTRCIFVENHGSALAPFLDMFNHHFRASIVTEFKDGTFYIRTRDSYEQGEEIFISYGSHDNRKLLINYGFVLESNPNDCVAVDSDHLSKLNDHLLFQDYSSKLQFIHSKNLFTEQTGVCADGLTWNLQIILSILSSRKDRMAEIFNDSDIRFERDAQSALIRILLDDYGEIIYSERFTMLLELLEIEVRLLENQLDK